MLQTLFKIWFMMAILPFLMLQEGYQMFKKYMSHGKRWDYFPYFLLAFLVILLIILLLAGFRY